MCDESNEFLKNMRKTVTDVTCNMKEEMEIDVHSDLTQAISEKTLDRIQYEQVKYNKCVRLPDSGGVLDYGSQFSNPIPQSFDNPILDAL